MHNRRRPAFAFVVAGLVSFVAAEAHAAGPSVVVKSVKGQVQIRAPGSKSYGAVDSGASVATGTRLKTAAGAEAVLGYPDGTKTTVAEKSEIIVRVAKKSSDSASGLTLFLGRVWSKVAKSAGGKTSFEVRSANAVAGVRGTDFEVGVAADGSAIVRVKEGAVAVAGDDEQPDAAVQGGYTVVSSGIGRLGKIRKRNRRFSWGKWFIAAARHMERKGLRVAKSLDGRLNRRKAKVERLLKKQRELRRKIQHLSKLEKRGKPVRKEMVATLRELKKVTARIEDMRARLEGAFRLFEHWNEKAQRGGYADADKITGMAKDIAKIAADFADMIEEGTDLSEEGMDDMMNDMKGGKRMGPGDSPADELFR